MKRIIILSILAVLCITSYGQSITWRTIETASPAPPVQEYPDTTEDSLAVLPSLTAIAHYQSHYQEVMSLRYPPVIELTLTLPDDSLVSSENIIDPGFDRDIKFLYEDEHVYLQADISFEFGAGTYAIQAVPLVGSTSRSTVKEALSDIDDAYAVISKPNDSGMLIFDITDIVDAIQSETVSNRVLIRPMANYDRFEMPVALASTPFVLKYVY